MTVDENKVNQNEEDKTNRDLWGSKAEFVLSCVGLSVGLGNVWRFPYLAYENGGGAFLLPYFILLILVGKPLYFLELAIGQYASLGPVSIWKCFPIAKGVGVAMVLISLLISVYYNILMSYTIYYMAQSFRSVLPWTGCYEWWGADNSTCYVRTNNKTRCTKAIDSWVEEYHNLTKYRNNTVVIHSNERDIYIPEPAFTKTMSSCTNATQTASEQFWERYVLDLSSGIEEAGTIKWDLALCVVAAWVIVFLCLAKGVKSSGKVVYFTATFPYVVLIAFVIYGLTLDGAFDGMYYLFVPEWRKLLSIKVWQKAAEQLFYSLGVSGGGLILYGSYNRFDNKVHRDAMFVSSLDFLTSVISGVVIFSVLGNMAKNAGLEIQDVAKQEEGLAFVAYPEAIVRLWFPQLWSFLFFFMLFLLGVDSEFALLETYFSGIYDEYPKAKKYKVVINCVTCVVCCLLGFSCVTQGGLYVLSLMNLHLGNFPTIFIAICELLALMWGYGLRRLCSDLEFMLGFQPGLYFKASWLLISPIVLTFILIAGLIDFTPITYNDGRPYPGWANGIGWMLTLIPMVQVPIWAIIALWKHRKNLRGAFVPSEDWSPGDKEAKEKRQLFNCVNAAFNNGIDNMALELTPNNLTTVKL